MIDGSHQIKRGMLWLGSATVVARLLDVGATFVVLGLLTQQEMGLGALVLSTAAVVESLSGIGIGAAIVQSKRISEREQSSLFWLTSLLGLALGGLLCVLAPVVSAAYDEPALLPLLALSGFKLLFVGVGVVPLQLMNKRLAFREVGAVQTLASLGEAAAKIALAAAGTGAWALAGGNVVRGLVLASIVFPFSGFRPRWCFAFAETLRFLRFGLQVAGSGVLQQLYRNADYFLVGKLLGIEALGLYRVAFDVAMQPTEAIIAVVNRVGYPVYSRLASAPDELFQAFVASTRSFVLMVAPVAAFVFLAAGDLLEILGDGRWAAAIPALRILALAGIVRAVAMTFPLVYLALGRPQLAVLDSLISLCVLSAGFLVALLELRDHGLIAVCLVWLLTYPLLLAGHLAVTARLIPLRLSSYLRALLPGLTGGGLLAAAALATRELLPVPDVSLLGLAGAAGAGLLVYVAYLRWGLGLRLRQLTAAPTTGHGPHAT